MMTRKEHFLLRLGTLVKIWWGLYLAERRGIDPVAVALGTIGGSVLTVWDRNNTRVELNIVSGKMEVDTWP